MLLERLSRTRKDGTNFVSARDLHEWLESGREFVDWVKQNITTSSYSFKKFIKEFDNEPVSHDLSNCIEVGKCEIAKVKVTLPQFKDTTFKNKVFVDYQLSLRIASHIAMISKCPKGDMARDYFYKLEELYSEQMENNLKLGSMLLTHKDKLNLTKEVFYPILDNLGVLSTKRNEVHKKIIKGIFGKYENVNKLTKITERDIENYKNLAENMKCDTRYFKDHNQIAVWDIINEF